jgi:hypothetical protein
MRENLPLAPGEAIAAAAEQEYHKDDDDDCCGVHGGEPTTNRASPSIFIQTPPRFATSRQPCQNEPDKRCLP